MTYEAESISNALFHIHNLHCIRLNRMERSYAAVHYYVEDAEKVSVAMEDERDIARGKNIGKLFIPAKDIFLEKNVFSWYKKFADILTPRDIPLIFHSDGNLFGVLDVIMDCGIRALHPIEPDAMKIMNVKKRVGNRLCLIGHIDVSGVLSLG